MEKVQLRFTPAFGLRYAPLAVLHGTGQILPELASARPKRPEPYILDFQIRWSEIRLTGHRHPSIADQICLLN